jgi:hypothetical protein
MMEALNCRLFSPLSKLTISPDVSVEESRRKLVRGLGSGLGVRSHVKTKRGLNTTVVHSLE